MSIKTDEMGHRIRNLRIARDIALPDAADALCVTAEYLRRIETGNRTPSLDLLISLARYYHTSTDYLLGGETLGNTILRKQLEKMAEQLMALSKQI